MPGKYKLFWGDAHTNLHAHQINPGALGRAAAHARDIMDFWPIAYYPAEKIKLQGFTAEDELPADLIGQQWRQICQLAADNNAPGRFVAFPGYEWQGDGSSGDHNVFFLRDDSPILIQPRRLADLYAEIRGRGLAAIAIPHHTGYRVGIRGKDWSVHDELLSPFAEIFSHHGSSENDDMQPGLQMNRNMCPGEYAGTIAAGLDRGLRLGIVASNDSHGGLGGIYGLGLMACYARELTRESLWEAFLARRVYGVSADRMELAFTAAGAFMGEEIRHAGPVEVHACARGSDRIDRIELLRNNCVIATHCHDGTWALPPEDQIGLFKLRIECGWGGRTSEVPQLGPHKWDCRLSVPDGQIVGVERWWRSDGQAVGPLGRGCQFTFTTAQQEPTGEPNTQANVFEIEARPRDMIEIEIDGQRRQLSLAQAAAGTWIMDFVPQAAEFVERTFGLAAADLPRTDRLYFTSRKARIHRAVPEAGYTACLDFVDEQPPPGVTHYRIRASQRNGSLAWSSPIWIQT